jgi:hypothetical protein
MSELNEYIVSLRSYEELDAFYDDMESPGGNLYIPNRAVNCVNRRPVSRNTHYLLSEQEAIQLRNDPRVLAVERLPEDLGYEITPAYVQVSAKWDKSATSTDNTHRNWGLYRCTLATSPTGWSYTTSPSRSGSINIGAAGKNVDVIITDGHVDPFHPEFAVNSDGGGGSRVIQFNWFSLNPTVTGSSTSTYVYAPYVDATYADTNGNGKSDRTDDNDHGCHVAGTSCGNTQGWARSANIYNISPYATNPNFISATNLFDYIKVFHQQKAINSETGRKNPTISNNSWAYGRTALLSEVTTIVYRGVPRSGPFTVAQAQSYGLRAYLGSDGKNYYRAPVRYTAVEIDVADCIAAGVIVVGAAGNDYTKIDISGGTDYQNYLMISGGLTIYYNQGCAPTAGTGVICVGAVGPNQTEYKATFSNCGPRVDIYAPGSYIMSSLNSNIQGGTYDSRNSFAYVSKYSGTSMASPQVAGLVACILEIYPSFNQAAVLKYLQDTAKYNQMTDGGGSSGAMGTTIDDTALQGSVNRYLYYNRETPVDGNIFPKLNYNSRPTTGQLYPRPRIYRYGKQS